MVAPELPARPPLSACRVIIKSGQEPTEREPKSPMIASPAADNLKPLQVGRFARLASLAEQGRPGRIASAPSCFALIRHGFSLVDTCGTKVQCSDKSAIQ